MSINIEQKLDRLFTLRNDAVELQIEKEKSQSSIIPREIREQLNFLEEEYFTKYQANLAEREQLEAEIRLAVARGMEKAQGRSGLSALPMPGRVTWDTRGLEGYAKAHGEVLEFRKVGDPFVIIK